jgi:hypothetical protein
MMSTSGLNKISQLHKLAKDKLEDEMGLAEKAAADAINKQAREVIKITRKFRFHELAPLITELKVLIEKGNALPDANPYIDPDEIEYPFDKVSAYLRGTKPKKVISKIEEAAPAHACDCDPLKCEHVATEEGISQIKGVRCHFCDEEILVGNAIHTSETIGEMMCPICARILTEKVRLKESVAYAVINLIEDACTECDDPFYQFKEAIKLVEESQTRLEEFRQVQRAKAALSQ